MELMEVPDWGSGPSVLSYPSLPPVRGIGTSKTVRRRHHKQALELERLVRGVVKLRGTDELPAPSHAAALPGEGPGAPPRKKARRAAEERASQTEAREPGLVSGGHLPATGPNSSQPAPAGKQTGQPAGAGQAKRRSGKEAAGEGQKRRKAAGVGPLAASHEASGHAGPSGKPEQRAAKRDTAAADPAPGAPDAKRRRRVARPAAAAAAAAAAADGAAVGVHAAETLAPRGSAPHGAEGGAAGVKRRKKKRTPPEAAEAAAAGGGPVAPSSTLGQEQVRPAHVEAAGSAERPTPNGANGCVRPARKPSKRNKFKLAAAAGAVAASRGAVAAAEPLATDTDPGLGGGARGAAGAAAPPAAQAPGKAAARATASGGRGSKEATWEPTNAEAAAGSSKPAAERPEAGAPVRSKGGPGGRREGAPGGLLGEMQARLAGGRFRWLNERLYTAASGDALALMRAQPELYAQYHEARAQPAVAEKSGLGFRMAANKAQPELYAQYHEGFRRQTAAWPVQPVHAAINWLAALPDGLAVADFGCGDAELAARARQRVHSFDLVAGAPGVVACNMARTPLDAASIDVAVFSLALMGTDYPAFLREAHRVLRPGGRLWIAEVRSRFAAAGREDVGPFLAALRGLGFDLVRQDAANAMFVVFELRKRGGGGPAAALDWPALKACQYKRR